MSTLLQAARKLCHAVTNGEPRDTLAFYASALSEALAEAPDKEGMDEPAGWRYKTPNGYVVTKTCTSSDSEPLYTRPSPARWSDEEIDLGVTAYCRALKDISGKEPTSDFPAFARMCIKYMLDHAFLSGEGEEKMPGVRPAVAWFAQKMEAALRRNDHKGGWSEMDEWSLCGRAQQELDELRLALNTYHPKGPRVATKEQVIMEAADVANFAMMVADVIGPRIGDTATPPTSQVDQGVTMSREPVMWVSDCCHQSIHTIDTMEGPEDSCRSCLQWCHPVPLYLDPAPSTREKELEEALRFLMDGVSCEDWGETGIDDPTPSLHTKEVPCPVCKARKLLNTTSDGK